jgi:hypothetical protein
MLEVNTTAIFRANNLHNPIHNTVPLPINYRNNPTIVLRDRTNHNIRHNMGKIPFKMISPSIPTIVKN